MRAAARTCFVPIVGALVLGACGADSSPFTRDSVTDAAPVTPHLATSALPALDLAAPQAFETATFALG